MSRNQKSSKKLPNVDENSEIFKTRVVPPLKLCNSPKVSESQAESSTLSYRMKRRNQVHRSLDFNLNTSLILTPRIIRADHNIIPSATPKANTYRKITFGSTVTVNNRKIARNLFLDYLPM
jgi:hypothetical protein